MVRPTRFVSENEVDESESRNLEFLDRDVGAKAFFV
jgi:hypothetical protein